MSLRAEYNTKEFIRRMQKGSIVVTCQQGKKLRDLM